MSADCNNPNCDPAKNPGTWYAESCVLGCTNKKIKGVSVCDCKWGCPYDEQLRACVRKLRSVVHACVTPLGTLMIVLHDQQPDLLTMPGTVHS
jgi:hypothetical protein